MSNFICSECGMTNIDCGRDGYKTPKEIELEKRLEVSEKEHYRTLEQLRIATGALSDIEDGYSEATGAGQIVRQAIKEMKEVK